MVATATAAPKATGSTREYETIYILRGNVDPTAAEGISTRAVGVITQTGGKLLKVDNWGRRRLAYPIAGATRGAFVYLRYLGGIDLVRELERNLAMFDEVVRWQSVLVRGSVAPESYQVSDDDVRYEPLEADTPQDEPGIADRLGLGDRPPEDEGSHRYDRDEGDRLDHDEDDGDDE